MDKVKFLKFLRAEGDLLLSSAALDLEAAVPTCPGWTVSDVLRHTAEVYEHKIVCVELAGTPPDWPPAWAADLDPLQWFADAHVRLLARLSDTAGDAPSWTWWPDDQTAGFWFRRMAQETAVHRADVQSASGRPSPVEPTLALDGIDEILHVMLAGDWREDPQPDAKGRITLSAADRRWTVEMRPDHIDVTNDADVSTDTQVTGSPSDLLLWLWGRPPDAAPAVAGDRDLARSLEERLRSATQ